MRNAIIAASVALLGVAAAAFLIPLSGDAESQGPPPGPQMDLSAYSDGPIAGSLPLVFLHHSVGGMLLADPGQESVEPSWIAASHPNGGGLRRMLAENGYEVHEAAYGSRVADKTDLFDWLPKFRTQMDDILRTEKNDEQLPDGRFNRVVMFKSCYPNSWFVGPGQEPGDPRGPELTVANARASFRELRGEFEKRPDTLFVYLTAPPLAPHTEEKMFKWILKRIVGRPGSAEALGRAGTHAREFNNWLRSPEGWLKDYPHRNVVVFDLFDTLTDEGASNLLRYPGGQNRDDSHPVAAGTQKAARGFVPFLNRAVRRAGLVP